ncbi:3-dehydroquinate synthase [Propionibacterium australiense]|uniref:Shikimate kinase n=2 Tax=Propionibacterium australiense TaxID=119981 RepID=A0A383S2S1_9ACTN|nr:3-dehydroquinate synthase [Propionibacterium australiense]RLP12739.1 3-dehydroquinate synthase [Propionibacterium australiense]SYZ32237.1 shikimate kinase/3-dehydroquinate synthase [Propionibacterium australiense]VEH90611.1 3-dehydroquinate synthase [Propionibacterium australiense]
MADDTQPPVQDCGDHSEHHPAVVLVGPPGAGKTTVGKLIARALELPFLDTDDEVERVAGMPIPEMFLTQGEPAFRALEHETVLRVLREFDGIVALGGGAVLHPGTQEALRQHMTVFLDVDVTQALPRVGLSGVRPLLMGDPVTKFNELMAQRRAIYESVSQIRLNTTGRRPQDSGEDILLALINAGTVNLPPGIVRRTASRHAPASVVTVTGQDGYDIRVGWGLLPEITELIPAGAERVLVAHEAVGAQTAAKLTQCLEDAGRQVVRHELPELRESKNLEVVARIWDLLAEHHFGRQDAIVAVGGAETTYLLGFVGATWLRGVPVVNVPTSLLAMVDASVGGKAALDLPRGRDLVGAFHPPHGVMCDLGLLESLPVEQLRSGLAEIIKAGFLGDERILRLIEANAGADALDIQSPVFRELMERALAVKARIVAEDLREIGLREVLNYGHTLGHAIENCGGPDVRHGDAVAIGMVFAAELSHRMGRLDVEVLTRHRAVLRMVGLPTCCSSASWAELSQAMSWDKKVRNGELRFVILEDIEKCAIARNPDERLLQQSWAALQS